RANNRDLAIQIDEGLENRFAFAERRPCGREVAGRRYHQLPLSVVAERGGLQDGGAGDARRRDGQIRLGTDRCERRYRDAVLGEERLLANAMLRDGERAAVRPDNRVLLGRRRRGGRYVLELERDHVDALRKGADRVDVVVRRVDLEVRHLSGRRVIVEIGRAHV